MLCSRCGRQIPVGSHFCNKCGTALMSSVNTTAQSVPTSTSGKAIASLILGFFSFLIPSAIAAIILGHVSRSEIRKSQGRLQGDGIALAGLIMGYMGITAIPVLIIAAIAIPNLLRARIAANEASAVASIRTLNIAEFGYAQSHRGDGFTCDLAALASSGLIDTQLSRGERDGYILELQNCAAKDATGPNVGYQVIARPVRANSTGVRAFCSDESGVIRTDSGGSFEACVATGGQLQ